MKPFVLNRYGRIVFPFNFFPALDFSVFETLEQFAAVIRRDFEERAPTESDIVRRLETGGYKGRHQELSRDELLSRIETWLGVPSGQVVREYGMTELTSQCYTAALGGGDPDLFLTPHWMRARVLHPETLAEQPPGESGLLALFDLANVGSAVHLLTAHARPRAA